MFARSCSSLRVCFVRFRYSYYCVLNFSKLVLLGNHSIVKILWKIRRRVANIVLNVRVTAGHRLAQVQEEPAGWGASPVFVWSHKIFFAKFMNSRALAGGFVIGCAKKQQKVVEKKQKSLQYNKKSEILDYSLKVGNPDQAAYTACSRCIMR